MILDDLKEVEQEMKRFSKRLRDFKKCESGVDFYNGGWLYGCKESGALRRSSLDLTRSLAKLRNNKNNI